jgi:hypothetical protein
MTPDAAFPLPRSLTRSIARLWALMLIVAMGLVWAPGPAAASLDNDRYDGNIFALYAGNGSLVPPRSTLAQSLAAHRVAVIIYYLDDSSVSKQFAPVVSELQRLWGNAIDLIPLVTDPLQNRPDGGPADPAHYWDGLIPQVVVIDADGRVVFDRHGQVSVDAINAAVSDATGIPMAPGAGSSATLSFNELNSEVVASR